MERSRHFRAIPFDELACKGLRCEKRRNHKFPRERLLLSLLHEPGRALIRAGFPRENATSSFRRFEFMKMTSRLICMRVYLPTCSRLFFPTDF